MKGRIYHNDWRITEAIDSYKMACDYAVESERYRHYVYYLLKLADIYRYDNDYESSNRCVQVADQYNIHFTPYRV